MFALEVEYDVEFQVEDEAEVKPYSKLNLNLELTQIQKFIMIKLNLTQS